MTGTMWESRDWWSRIASCLALPFVGLAVAAFGSLLFFASVEKGYLSFLSGLFLMVIGFLMVFKNGTERVYSSGADEALAVLDGNGKINWSGLKKVYLRPWPFKSRLKVLRYPTKFVFRTFLHPITSNPKVIPLDVSVMVELTKDTMIPLHFYSTFRDFLFNPELARKEFYKTAFESLQHNLPQELANRLNPYDPQTVFELEDYVTASLRGKLPLEYSVSCALKDRN